MLYIPQYCVHRDPDTWGPDAHVFRPERWLDEAYMSALHPYAFHPFSKGPRDCLGQNFALLEAKALVAMLVSRYVFHVFDSESKFRSPFLNSIYEPPHHHPAAAVVQVHV